MYFASQLFLFCFGFIRGGYLAEVAQCGRGFVGYEPLVMVRREFPYHRWEPIYIGTNREPLYSEVLTWEGKQDKMTQMHQMCLLGYRFVILDRAFLVHTPGVKRPQPPRSLRGQPVKVEPLDEGAERQKEWVRSHEKRNTHLYEMIVESMNLAHPRNPRCRS